MLAALFTRLSAEVRLTDRLAAIPLEGAPVEGETTIHWDDNQIPFIEASSDTDLAVALGIAHAHLRLGQMEMMRRLSQGRLAEMAGPLAVPIDHALRILDFGRAVGEIEAALPADTRQWLEGFVGGINHYLYKVERLPKEFSILGLRRERWTVADILTLGRLAATDVNWLVWFPLLRLRERDDWQDIWKRLVQTGSASLPSFRRRGRLAFMSRLIRSFARSGSNAFAVAGRCSASGAAMMANDPHLEIMLPNLWLIAGYRSPSYHAVGLMIAGLPFIGLGRNRHIAWGGTNMRAASSDLYDISHLEPGEIRERTETVRVRWWFDRKVTVRECDLGPVLSDAPPLKKAGVPPFALSWLGHRPSDEFSAMLRMNRARNWQEFRAAFDSFAVAGLNMLYADTGGDIGQVLAVQLPGREGGAPADLVLDPRDPSTRWNGIVRSSELPSVFDPDSGFLVSANNRPVETNVPISFFFASDDRVWRISALLDRNAKHELIDLREIQRDVYMSSAVVLRDLLVDKLGELGLARRDDGAERELVALVGAWDGHYRASSRGALAFELFLHHFARVFYGHGFTKHAAAGYSGVVRIKLFLAEDVEKAAPNGLARDLDKAIRLAARRLRSFGNWGDMHRLALAHPLAQMPVVGRRYRFGNYPIGGSTDTVMKTAHSLTDKRHAIDYGANARHISDMSDVDRNFFVLLGGQDGWFGSSTFMNHLPMWFEGAYVQVPLRLKTVREKFARRTVLQPPTAAAS